MNFKNSWSGIAQGPYSGQNKPEDGLYSCLDTLIGRNKTRRHPSFETLLLDALDAQGDRQTSRQLDLSRSRLWHEFGNDFFCNHVQGPDRLHNEVRLCLMQFRNFASHEHGKPGILLLILGGHDGFDEPAEPLPG